MKKKYYSIKKNKRSRRKKVIHHDGAIGYSAIVTLPKGTLLYRIRNFGEKSLLNFDRTYWFFLAENEDEYVQSLWKLSQYRKQSLEEYDHDLLYSLPVDTFEIINDILLYQITANEPSTYVSLEKNIKKEDPTYIPSFTTATSGDNFVPAKWLEKNEEQYFGWLDTSFPSLLIEVMLLPRVKDNIKHIKSETLKSIFDKYFKPKTKYTIKPKSNFKKYFKHFK